MTGVDCLTASPGNGQSWYSLGDICRDGPCGDTEQPGQRGPEGRRAGGQSSVWTGCSDGVL